MVVFRGESFVLLPSGALHWPRRQALVVADLHLGKFAAFARGGQLLPPYDTGVTLSRLEADIAATGVETVVSLGDAFHRDDGPALLDGIDLARLGAVCRAVAWIWISGNHDPSRQGMAGTVADRWTLDGLTFVHDVTGMPEGSVGGHLHPGARVAINGRSARSRCLVHDGRRMILPAYGSATGCLDLHHPAFRAALEIDAIDVTMLGRDRVYRVPVSRLVR